MNFIKTYLSTAVRISCIFLGINAYSQTNLTSTFEESFENNKREWPIGIAAGKKSKIINRQLHIRFANSKAIEHFETSHFIDPGANFLLHTKITFVSRNESSNFGIFFGKRDLYNFNLLEIGPTGLIKLTGYKNKRHIKLMKASMLPVDEYEVRIEKTGPQTYEININDSIVAHINQHINFYGDLLGFHVHGAQQLAIDYFKVSQKYKHEINLATLDFQPKKSFLPSHINSPYAELAPIYSPINQTLYFSRLGHPDNEFQAQANEIWFSKKLNNKQWSEPQLLGAPINNAGTNWTISSCLDTNVLFVSGIYNEDNKIIEEGISKSVRIDGNWSAPVAIPIKSFWNKSNLSGFALSPDRLILVMSIEQEDGLGGTDLYVSKWVQDKNRFSRPRHMGSEINTFANDFTPYLAADKKTLYYASEGLPGYGQADIYMSRRLDNSWKNWSKPVNLGPAINSNHFDAYFNIAHQSNEAYFISYDSENESADILSVTLPDSLQPDACAWLQIKTTNCMENSPIKITLYHKTLQKFKTYHFKQKNNEAHEIIIQNNEYGVIVESPGYKKQSFAIRAENGAIIQKTIELKQEKETLPILLESIYFDYSSNSINKNQYKKLDKIINHSNDRGTLYLIGHTDSHGKSEDNMTLSRSRAESVKSYLINNARFPSSKIIVEARGESEPWSDQDALNRRVELLWVKP